MKKFEEISWLVTEEEYRADKALSYSTLSTYERTGFNNLAHLFDFKTSPSLTFGSAVDAIITGGMGEFNSRFIVFDIPEVPDSVITVVKSLYAKYGDKCRSIYEIPVADRITETEIQKYQLNWKPETRAKVICEKGFEYYDALCKAEGKTILNTALNDLVMGAVNALKESKATKYYFQEDNPFEHIERKYQLKFKGTFNGINYRNMADEIIIDYDKKTVLPIDLKTSSHTEWDFFQSFVDWNYMIQARLYWRIIRQNMDNDEDFKDFTLLDYKFIVVNKETLTPLVWEYADTQKMGPLVYGKNKNIVCRDPFDIGEELYAYLKDTPRVPKGIKLDKENSLVKYLKNL